jgi:hypothetical protein
MQCGARSKHSQQQCRRAAVPGKRVCRLHGGLTPGGIASPHFKNRGRSKYLPARMLASYNEALAVKSLSLRQDVAVIEARIVDLLTRVDAGESGQLWQDLRKLATDMLTAREQQDYARVAVLLTDLVQQVEKGAADHQLWEEIITLTLKKSKVVATEHKMMVDGQQLIRLDQVLWLVTALIDAIQKVETDREKLAAIHTEFCRVLPPGLLTDEPKRTLH